MEAMRHSGILHRAPSQVASYAHSFRRLISNNAKTGSLSHTLSSTRFDEPAADDARLAGGENDGREILQVDPLSKTIHTAVGSLPISPLMDPAFHGARERFQQTKQPEARTQDKLKWRRALERNPYGTFYWSTRSRPDLLCSTLAHPVEQLRHWRLP